MTAPRRAAAVSATRTTEPRPQPTRGETVSETAVCGMRKPGSNSTCIEPAGHAGPAGKGESHGDGSVIRWIYR